jgi:hypothetical protein
MFWFKTKEIVVDCFTNDELVYNNFKIERAKEFIPSWWKSLAHNNQIKVIKHPNSRMTIQELNLKHCNGFRDLFSVGFIIPNWLDYQIEMIDENNFCVAGYHAPLVKINVEHHDRKQTGYEIYPDCSQLKILSPWVFREKSGVKFSWNACMWNNTSYLNDMHLLSGVIDFKTQGSTNINTFIRKGSIVKLNAGDPLIHLIPISDKKINVKNHIISDHEMERMIHNQRNAGDYKNNKSMTRIVDKKCPFGFGRN